jgi:hypothetical protein
MKRETETPEWKRFNAAMRTILSVSHDELKRREAEWKKNRKARKKRPKPSASRAAAVV